MPRWKMMADMRGRGFIWGMSSVLSYIIDGAALEVEGKSKVRKVRSRWLGTEGRVSGIKKR